MQLRTSLILLTFLIVLTSFNVLARDYSIGPKVTILEFNSKVLNKTLAVRLVLPRNYDDNKNVRYPLMVSLAGDSQINSLIATTDWLSHVSFGPMPEVILVQYFLQDEPQRKVEQVLVDELLPFIRTHYRTERLTILEGFSTSGVTALEYFARYPEHFQAAILPSAGLGLETEQWLSDMVSLLIKTLNERFLFISQSSMSDDHQPFVRLQAELKRFKHAKLEDLSALNYLSSSLIGFEMGIRSLFSEREITDYKPFAKEGIKGVLSYHQKLSDRLGFMVDDIDNLMGLARFYFENDALQKGVEVYEYLIKRDTANILIHIRFAQALISINERKLAKTQLEKARLLAHQQENSEALEFIQNLLSPLPN